MDGRERDLFDSLEKQGFIVDKTKSSHIKIICPTGKTIYTASTTRNWRGRLNLIGRLKREGFKWRNNVGRKRDSSSDG